MTQIQNALIETIKRNIMGTASIVMKIAGMRKFQDFIVYPIQSGNDGKYITIQSDTRIGKIEMETGRGLMSHSHANGAYFHHLSFDVKTPFQLSALDLQALKLQVFASSSSHAGDNGIVYSDNSNAHKVL